MLVVTYLNISGLAPAWYNVAMLTSSDFDYHLPTALIANQPMQPRDHSRLLVVDRATQTLSHHYFYELSELLSTNDVLVRNDTKVFPARLIGNKKNGGNIELLLINRVTNDGADSAPFDTQSPPDTDQTTVSWNCLTKPGLKLGQEFTCGAELTGRCIGESGYTRTIEFDCTSWANFWEVLYKLGATPLPPYIHSSSTEEQLRSEYQTTYAQVTGSAAAPTAGLHFTPELDARLHKMGIETVALTLHVGLGTFLPVKTEAIKDHQMHEEWYQLSSTAAVALNRAKSNSQRLIAVGTTSTRVLESISQPFAATSGTTDIFIYPPHQFRAIDGLLTNFHQPKSTLLMLVSAFASTPNTEHEFTTFSESLIGKAYQEAIQKKYRFHSFGDAMLIL